MTERTGKNQVLLSALVESFVDGEIAIDTEGYHTKEGVMRLYESPWKAADRKWTHCRKLNENDRI
jgi:hypothetical protein